MRMYMTLQECNLGQKKVLEILRDEYGIAEHYLLQVIDAYGDDLSTSVSLGFSAHAIANDLFYRWIGE